jgi:benzoate membrane transport protein
MILEKGPGLRQSLRDLPKAVNRGNLTNGFVAALFGMTAPLLLVLAATRAGNLHFNIVSSWLFVGYSLAGLSTIVQALYYRIPTSIAWTLPGTVLVGAALSHMGFDEVVGVYMTTAALLFILGATGLIRPLMARLPMPIAMGMVAGVFLPFGLHIISSFSALPLVAAVTVLAYAAFSWAPRISRQVPPLLGAIIAGLLVTTLTFPDRIAHPHVPLRGSRAQHPGHLRLKGGALRSARERLDGKLRGAWRRDRPIRHRLVVHHRADQCD